MNLIIEQGNSAVKIAVYDRHAMVFSSVHDDVEETDLMQLFKKYPLRRGIISSVVGIDNKSISFLNQRLEHFIILDEHVRLPIEIRYTTPHTLGRDRIAVAVGANYLQPDRDILVIDAGTAITYEVIVTPGIYLGGNISPGMTTRFKALNRFTEQLPLVSRQDDVPLIGTSTESAILAGVVNGIVYEMDGYIDTLRSKYPGLYVFLTGGHSIYFEKRLKNTIFAAINLVLTGLNRILEYNVED
ncbi:MAG: type III pantothenate kinase [Tannerella sp.]|nr:type III pantothenate kinase [Tannerella sp.]